MGYADEKVSKGKEHQQRPAKCRRLPSRQLLIGVTSHAVRIANLACKHHSHQHIDAVVLSTGQQVIRSCAKQVLSDRRNCTRSCDLLVTTTRGRCRRRFPSPMIYSPPEMRPGAQQRYTNSFPPEISSQTDYRGDGAKRADDGYPGMGRKGSVQKNTDNRRAQGGRRQNSYDKDRSLQWRHRNNIALFCRLALTW